MADAEKKRLPLRRFVKQLLKRITDNRVPDLAAQLAYYFMLALFPFLVFSLTLLGYYVSAADVLALIGQYVPADAMPFIEKNVRSVLRVNRGALLPMGVIAAIWSASNATGALIRALNQAYAVKESRPFWQARLVAIALMFAVIGALLVALVFPVFGQAIGTLLFSAFGWSVTFLALWHVLRWGFSFIVLMGIFMCLYYFAPNTRLGMKETAAGALFATISWQLVSFTFSAFVSQFGNYSATYGSLAGVIILMVWFYLTGFIMLIGGEVSAALHDMQSRKKLS